MDLAIPASGSKHEVAVEDMLHAYQHAVRVFETHGLVILIGADRAGCLLEVGLASAEAMDFVVPAASARAKSLR
ncbi:MAG: hypothetical protein JW785_08805 [Acidimicrobiia bacterium]|nr:hypothetical protein [Acidimicrobiia bacterium]